MNDSNDELPENVRRVAGPAVRWQIRTTPGYVYDGYVFEDDPSDLAKFMRWLVQTGGGQSCHLQVQKTAL